MDDDVSAARDLGADVFAASRPFEQHAEVVGAAPERLEEGEIAFHAAAALHDFLRLGLAAPEIRRRARRFDFVQLRLKVGTLKGASAARGLASSARRTAA
jgi:hypothetical protein